MHISNNFARNEHQIVVSHSKSTISHQFIKNFKTIAQTMLSFDQFFMNTHETQVTKTYSLDHSMTNIAQIDINSLQITRESTIENKLKKIFAKARNEKLTKKMIKNIIDLTKESRKKERLKVRKLEKTIFQKSIMKNQKKVSTKKSRKKRLFKTQTRTKEKTKKKKKISTTQLKKKNSTTQSRTKKKKT